MHVVGFLLAAAATATHLLLYLGGYYGRDVNLFQNDVARTFDRVAGTVAVALCAVAAIGLALATPVRRRASAAVALLAALFAADKAVGIHERLAHGVLDGLGIENVGITPVWIPLYVPVLAVGALCMLAIDRSWPHTPRLIRYGVALLGAALLCQAAWVIARHVTAPAGLTHFVEVVCEEGLELAGWTAVATGLWVAVVRVVRTPRTRLSFG